MSSLREWAEVCLDQLEIKLMEDPQLHEKHGQHASRIATSYVEALRRRVLNDEIVQNPRYQRQSELASALIVLAMEYPERYFGLMHHVAGRASVQTLNGVSRLEAVLNSLSDDHDYTLIQDEDGTHQLHHESTWPKERGFSPLTCSRDLCVATFSLLEQAGFDLNERGTEPWTTPG